MIKRQLSLLLICLLITLPISFSLSISNNLEYDSNGNLIEDSEKEYRYNGQNQLIEIRDQNGDTLEEYSYDYNGKRIIKKTYDFEGKETTTYYIDKNLIRLVDDTGTHDNYYYYHNGQLIAKESDGSKQFYHPDHLGSTNLITNSNGNIIEETNYLPFGKVLDGGSSRFTFTGQELDQSGMLYYGARYYNPIYRKFTQPDTIIQDVYNPQSLNRYSYVHNNPVKYTDPSGHAVCGGACLYLAGIAAWTIGGAVVSTGFNLISQIRNGASVLSGTADWGPAGRSAGSGAIGGLVAGVTQGIVSPVFQGANGLAKIAGSTSSLASSAMAGSVAGQATSNIMSGQAVTNNVFESAVSGAKWGGAVGAVAGGISSIGFLTRGVSEKTNIGKTENPFKVLHPNQNDNLMKSVNRPFAGRQGEGYILDMYNNGRITVHRYGAYSKTAGQPSNIHIDLGVQHQSKLSIEKLAVDNTKLKDLYPLFEP